MTDTLRRVAGAVEEGDRPMPAVELTAYLDDLERLNAWFRGYAGTSSAIDDLARTATARRPLVIADVGGARGDLAVRIVERARASGRRVTVVVVDRGEMGLSLGRRARKDYPEIHWVQADAAALPFRPHAVDIAVMTLTLHHLEPDAAVACLSALRRAVRLGAVVDDLIRSRLAYALVTLATRLFARHPASRVDGPLSVRRAYTPVEMTELAQHAGFRTVEVRQSRLFARFVAVLA